MSETCPSCRGTGRDPSESTSMCMTCGGTKVMGAERVGLLTKWDVRRRNDDPGKHDDCWTFVLDPQHDAIARVALVAYAAEALRLGYTELWNDLVRRLA